MRYLILSDIHANWEALQAVLADAREQYDQIINCGDIVGYGPDPNAVVDWCREHTPRVIRGNHDKACAGLGDLEWFNPVARASAVWTQGDLTQENLAWLRDLPRGPLSVDGFSLIHGAPQDEDEYLIDSGDIEFSARFLTHPVSFFGHTHLQGAYFVHRNGVQRVRRMEFELEVDVLYMINPGSVGQPRDGDPRAAYALYDSDRKVVRLCRTDYPLAETQQKILQAGLPELLALRLEAGS